MTQDATPGALPTHPDLGRLHALLEALTVERPDVAPLVDPASLTYLGLQRSMQATGLMTPEAVIGEYSHLLKAALALYQEAFILGARWQQERNR